MSRFQTLRKESARRHRRANGFLAGILVAALVLGLSAMLYTDSYEQALEQQRQMLYGAWHVAGYGVSEAAAETYAAHATVEEVGQMTLYGTVQSDGAILGGLGRVDETLAEVREQLKTTAKEIEHERNDMKLEHGFRKFLFWAAPILLLAQTFAILFLIVM